MNAPVGFETCTLLNTLILFFFHFVSFYKLNWLGNLHFNAAEQVFILRVSPGAGFYYFIISAMLLVLATFIPKNLILETLWQYSSFSSQATLITKKIKRKTITIPTAPQ